MPREYVIGRGHEPARPGQRNPRSSVLTTPRERSAPPAERSPCHSSVAGGPHDLARRAIPKSASAHGRGACVTPGPLAGTTHSPGSPHARRRRTTPPISSRTAGVAGGSTRRREDHRRRLGRPADRHARCRDPNASLCSAAADSVRSGACPAAADARHFEVAHEVQEHRCVIGLAGADQGDHRSAVSVDELMDLRGQPAP